LISSKSRFGWLMASSFIVYEMCKAIYYALNIYRLNKLYEDEIVSPFTGLPPISVIPEIILHTGFYTLALSLLYNRTLIEKYGIKDQLAIQAIIIGILFHLFTPKTFALLW